MPISATVNLNQGPTVQISSQKTVAAVSPLTVGPATSLLSLSQIGDVNAPANPPNLSLPIYNISTARYDVRNISIQDLFDGGIINGGTY